VHVDAVTAGEGGLARLSGTRWGPVTQLVETTSTNSVLLSQAQAGAPEGLVAVADFQTAGRGRFERRWEAPPGTSLLFSVLLRPPAGELPPGRRHLAVAAVSLAVAEAARLVAGAELALKWPNDLVVAAGPLVDCKVAGVLAETAATPAPAPAIVIGVGVNVRWAPPQATATSLDVLAGRPVGRDELLVESLLALDRLYGHWDLVSRRYREASATVGREVTVSFAVGSPDACSPDACSPDVGPPGAPAAQPDLRGTAVDVDDNGRLVVQTRSGDVIKVAAGDVTHATVPARSRVGKQ
jgi:BirA family biotin operon repressor/biotin-[acetyl-CoA-carboxylase] ligase